MATHPWAQRYLAGETIQSIADRSGCGKDKVRLTLARNGVRRRPRGALVGTVTYNGPRVLGEREQLTDAALGSRNLLMRLLQYGSENKGLPNMTPDMCRQQLNAIGRAR